MNIAVVGSTGHIGSALMRVLPNIENVKKILPISRNVNSGQFLDLMYSSDFPYDMLDQIDYVIFTACVVSQDKCADEWEYCYQINVTGTVEFIKMALERNCKVIFFSSDAVYGNDMGKIYNEHSDTFATTPYGIMKKEVEESFKGNRNFKSIRLSYVLSGKDKFTSYLVDCNKKGEIAEIYHPFYRNVVTMDDVIRATIWLIFHWECIDGQVLCVSGYELISRVRIVDELNRLFFNRIEYKIKCSDMAFFRNRSIVTQMESLYLNKFNIVSFNSFSEKIKCQFKLSDTIFSDTNKNIQ